MSLYNMMNGVTPAVLLFLPMLDNHPDKYPRFRDCFLSDPEKPEYNNHIIVYTRTGGGNRETYSNEYGYKRCWDISDEEYTKPEYMFNDELKQLPGFVSDYDDDFDSTFANWVFNVPEQWQDDYEKLTKGKANQVSKQYIKQIKKVFPKLADKIDEIFNELTTS